MESHVLETSFPRWLKEFALKSLGPMYDRRKGLFHFQVRKTGNGVVPAGISRRYSAITLIGLSGEEDSVARDVLSGDSPERVYARLLEGVPDDKNLGDAALTLWAGVALRHEEILRALERVRTILKTEGGHPTVELSWALVALCKAGRPEDSDVRDAVANRIKEACRRESDLFPYHVGNQRSGARSHVSCFADLVYPVQALSIYSRATGDRHSLEIAARCARRFCRLQGKTGQWWWHYDGRTGRVLEGYPVYAIHQDAMAPMALFDLEEAGGPAFHREIHRGLEWLRNSPELKGGTLIDEEAGIIWRKVARDEPGKLSRYVQASAAKIHPEFRVPALDFFFPPGKVDFEDRPYHIGWLLHAWTPERLSLWESGKNAI